MNSSMVLAVEFKEDEKCFQNAEPGARLPFDSLLNEEMFTGSNCVCRDCLQMLEQVHLLKCSNRRR